MSSRTGSSCVWILALALLLAGASQPVARAAGDPDPPSTSDAPAAVGPLHTDGARLLDAAGHEVRVTGVNWFGLETDTFAPHGLWARRYTDMLDQIVAAGFNTIRLPYSNQLLEPGSKPKGIDEQQNPELSGLSGLELLDRVVDAAGQRGLWVILDRHRPMAAAQSELWYTPEVSEARWIEDWVTLARRYAGNPTVIGADLHNEPHGPATWGDGNPRTDWRLAAERAGNAILAVNPDWLILVEGVERIGAADWYWWGGNLAGARQAPVRLTVPDKLVYSPHDYGPGVYPQGWFSAPDFPANLPRIWRDHWGYLQQDGIAPVIVGEFGGRSVGGDKEGVWQRSLLSFLQANGLSYTYWAWNPDSADTGGILEDDWTTLDRNKLGILAAYQWQGGQGSAEAMEPPPVAALPPPPASLQPPVDVVPPPASSEPAAPGGPFDPDLRHALDGIGGPTDPDPVHRQARARDEQRYLALFGKPWPYAAYVTAAPSATTVP